MMHIFDYTEHPKRVMEPEVVRLLMQVSELKGRVQIHMEDTPALLDTLREVAKIQSTSASNRIEGICTTNERLLALMQQKTEPRNRSEEEIAGYRDVLSTIHEHYNYIPPLPSWILQMHRDLYAYNGRGGHWKTADNIIAETDAAGTKRVRFEPMPAHQTPEAMDFLCASFHQALEKGEFHALILIPMFILDFLCIHPFHDGNGRMSRLLTTLLLYRSGYDVGRYISLEQIIDNAKESYYGALHSGSLHWHDNNSDYVPFVRYFLGILTRAYSELNERLSAASNMSKPDRVRNLFANSLNPLSKSQIAEKCPDISLITIERALRDLLKENYILRIGKGRASAYIRKG